MMVLKGEWAFVSTQKCATNTMYAVLPGGRQGAFHHMPKKRVAPMHWTVVRNPYDRAVSLYGSTGCRNHDKYHVKRECGSGNQPPEFEKFVELCLLKPQKQWRFKRAATHKWLFRNQSDWIDSGVIDEVVHLENLHQEVLDLIGLDLTLTNANASPRSDWKDYMTPAVKDMLNQWAGNDFRYGYKKL